MQLSAGIVIFDGFETLDVFGPVELLGMYAETFDMHLVAETVGDVKSAQGLLSRPTRSFDEDTQYDIILVPGGQGTRTQVSNDTMLGWISQQARTARFVTSVCTGSALLARAGVLDGRRATSNKMNFSWVTGQGPGVDWVFDARWVEDGNILTSSGVSAGMDMTLALIAHVMSERAASDAAIWAEYTWHRDADSDPFADIWRDRQTG